MKLGVGGGRSSSGCERNGDRTMRRMGNNVEELLWGISKTQKYCWITLLAQMILKTHEFPTAGFI